MWNVAGEKSPNIDSATILVHDDVMKVMNTREAKTQLSQLLRRVAAEEEFTITNRGVPLARLVPVPPSPPRRLGILKDTLKIPDDFDGPLPDRKRELEGGAVDPTGNEASRRYSEELGVGDGD